MVEGEGEVGFEANGDHVVDDADALFDCADAEDGGLGLVDDGGGK